MTESYKEMMSPTLVFNPDGVDTKESRQIWGGPATGNFNLNELAYPWALDLYKKMRGDFWGTDKLDLVPDINQYYELSEAERYCYGIILSYLNFLDSTQSRYVPKFAWNITAGEIIFCINEQTSQETLHSETYRYMIDTIIPSYEKGKVYDYWRTDSILKERCNYIASLYQSFLDFPTRENYFIALFADLMLEGLYFYAGFNFYFNLDFRQLMPGSASAFRLINQDELSHVTLYSRLVNYAKASGYFPYSEDQMAELLYGAAEQEKAFMGHILTEKGDIVGFSPEAAFEYDEWKANQLAKSVGLKPIYNKRLSNPFSHLEQSANVLDSSFMRSNFFEGNVTNYTVGVMTGKEKLKSRNFSW